LKYDLVLQFYLSKHVIYKCLYASFVGRAVLCSYESIKAFNVVLSAKQPSAIRFRVYETLIEIGKASGMLQEFDTEYKIVDTLCKLSVNNDDPLEQINALEVLLLLADDESGRKSLNGNSIHQSLTR